jgi:type II secretory pathway pseudopilin PulG
MLRKRLGMSLFELLVVIAIIMVIAGIILPVTVKAVHRAKQTSSMSKLKQLHLATMMYRTEYYGDAVYGQIDAMGLPPATPAKWVEARLGQPMSLMQSSCGRHPSMPPVTYDVYYTPGRGDAPFPANAILFQENLVLFYDMSCSDSDVALMNEFQTHLGIGVLLGGNAVVHRKPGRWWDPDWWADPAS